VEIGALHDGGWLILLNDPLEELGWFEVEQIVRWFERDNLVGSGFDESSGALLERSESLWSFFGLEVGDRVRFEGADDDSARFSGEIDGSADECLVAEVDAVEVSDADDCLCGHGFKGRVDVGVERLERRKLNRRTGEKNTGQALYPEPACTEPIECVEGPRLRLSRATLSRLEREFDHEGEESGFVV